MKLSTKQQGETRSQYVLGNVGFVEKMLESISKSPLFGILTYFPLYFPLKPKE